MRKFHFVILAFLAFFLAGCYESSEPEKVEYTTRGIAVSTLFTKDNCTVYRFVDGNVRTVYYADCSGSASTMTEESCGKNCTFPQVVTSTAKKE